MRDPRAAPATQGLLPHPLTLIHEPPFHPHTPNTPGSPQQHRPDRLDLEVCEVLPDARVPPAPEPDEGEGLALVLLAGRREAVGLVRVGAVKDGGQDVAEVGGRGDDVALWCGWVGGGVGGGVCGWCVGGKACWERLGWARLPCRCSSQKLPQQRRSASDPAPPSTHPRIRNRPPNTRTHPKPTHRGHGVAAPL